MQEATASLDDFFGGILQMVTAPVDATRLAVRTHDAFRKVAGQKLLDVGYVPGQNVVILYFENHRLTLPSLTCEPHGT